MMLPWWAASLLSNLCLIYIEYVNRTTIGGWAPALWRTFIPIVLAQYFLFRAFNGAPAWLIAWAFFTVGNSITRVGSVAMFADGEVVSWPRIIIGISGMFACSYILKGGVK